MNRLYGDTPDGVEQTLEDDDHDDDDEDTDEDYEIYSNESSLSVTHTTARTPYPQKPCVLHVI